MAANTSPIFPITPKIMSAGITIANFAKGGTVAFGGTGASFITVFSAGGYGSRIDQIKVRSMGLNGAGVLRLFTCEAVSGATSPNFLIHETALSSIGATGATIAVTSQVGINNIFVSSVSHGLTPGQIVFFGLTAGLTAVGQSTAYYVQSVPGPTTFTLLTLTGSPVIVGSTIPTGASLFPYTFLEGTATTDYDITISKNTTETVSPIPYLPPYWQIRATVGAVGATPTNMGWEVTVHGADY